MGRTIFNIIFLFFLFVLNGTNSFGQDAAGILQGLNFSPLASAPIEFSLDNLQGKEISLKEHKGKWIWLNFWATWCGPCRMEMPELSKLYDDFAGKDFVVLGVATDGVNKRAVNSFVKKNGISFPILLDSSQEVSGKYQASALPTIYVISPDWKLVGVFRGANKWDTPIIREQLKKLLTFKTIDLKVDRTAKPSVELPNNLIPPSIKVILPDREPQVVDTPFELQVELSWQGDARMYSLKTPKLTLGEEVFLGNVSSQSTSNVGSSILRYRYPLTVKTPGKHMIGPVELSYSPRGGGKELFSRADAIEILVKDSFFVENWLYLLFIGTIILLTILGFILFLAKKRKKVAADSASKDCQLYQEAIAVQGLRRTASEAKYEAELIRFVVRAEPSSNEVVKLEVLLQEITYAGKKLTPTEKNYYEKKLRKHIEKSDDNLEE